MTQLELDELFIAACQRVLDLEYSYVSVADADKLDKVLGLNEYDKWCRNIMDPMTDEVRHLFSQLAGPHGKTVLKAYRIQKGLE